MTKKTAEDFFTNYANQFLSANLEGIAAHFHYPCIIDNAQTPVVAIETAQELMEHEKAAVEGFQANGITQAKMSVKKLDTYGEQAGVAHVAFELFVQETHAATINWLYQLVQTGSEPKILTAKFLG